ncbi:MAG: glucosidase family protein, partial [Armatimonadota bacterium]
LANRDIDGDGMIESKQSGNRGTLVDPMRGSTWWDTINSGYKDGYLNALTYRAWRCLADLENKLNRSDKADRYATLASRMKRVYRDTLYNPSTGWLGWWRSQDGELHDYASPMINGMAIEYGLVGKTEGRKILTRLRCKIKEVGYDRFDLGVPATLIAICKDDYILPPVNGAGLSPGSFGIPSRDDGADALGYYENGGVHAGNTLPFLAAHYVVGDPKSADRILMAMLNRQDKGLFQNGVWGQVGKGTEWTTWDGEPSGADGYLADNFRFLQAVFLHDAANRARFYRPLRDIRTKADK